MGQYTLTVTGVLIAEGTENDSIRFTSGNRRPFEGDWGSITFNTSEAAASVFSHVIVEYGNVGIYLHYTSLNLSHCRISDNYCGIEMVETIAPLINFNYFSSNYNEDIKIHASSAGTISNNYFTGSYEGILLYEMNSPVITENIFKNADFRAITGQSGNPEISYNQFINNPWNIILQDCDAYIHHNFFCGEGDYGIYDFGNTYNVANIYNNTFCNLTYGIKASHSAGFPVMNNAFYGNSIALYTNDSIASVSYNLFYNNVVDYGGESPLWFGVTDYDNGNNDPCDENYNLFISPEFVDPQSLDFHLTENSPCINAGNPDPQYNDPNGTICDIGAYYYPHLVDNEDDNITDTGFSLTNYPNPFNPFTTIDFNITQPEACTLSIYNIKGELVKTLLKDNLEAGKHTITWDGSNDNNKITASGIYFCRLKSGENEQTRRILQLK
jgi:parallel beta-helix repeat protein